MVDRADALDRDVAVVKEGEGEGGVTRLLVAHGTEDRITSFETSKRWFARLKVADKEFRAYDGWFHKCKYSLKLLDTAVQMLNSYFFCKYTQSLATTESYLRTMLPTGFWRVQVLRILLRIYKPRANYRFLG